MSEADGVMLGTDAVYVNRNTTGTSRVSAYDLDTGALRWEKWENQTNGDLQLIEQAGLVLLTTDVIDQISVPAGRRSRSTPAPAGAVGRERADRRGPRHHRADGRLHHPRHAYRLRLIRLADRAVIWTRTPPTCMCSRSVGERLIMATMDGRVEIRRLADGSRLAGGRVRWFKPNPEANQFDDLNLVGDQLDPDPQLAGARRHHRLPAGHDDREVAAARHRQGLRLRLRPRALRVPGFGPHRVRPGDRHPALAGAPASTTRSPRPTTGSSSTGAATACS